MPALEHREPVGSLLLPAALGADAYQAAVEQADAAGEHALAAEIPPAGYRAAPAAAKVGLGADTRPYDLCHSFVHYHFSGVAGVVLGRNVAKYDLGHAFRPSD